MIAAVSAAALSAAAGDLDGSFDGDGKARTDFAGGSDDRAYDVVAQRDDKVVLVGESRQGTDIGFAVARYAVNGALDPTFDGDGKVRTDFGMNTLDTASSVAVQPDGKILVGGVVGGVNPGTSFDFALARYNPNGTLDPSFDGDGRVVTDIEGGRDWLAAVAPQADGKIVVGGQARPRGPGAHDFALARYNPDGSLDSSFGANGKVVTAFGGGADDFALDVEIDGSGRIVAAGWTSPPGRDLDFALARYTADGNLDPSFGGGGTIVIGSAPGIVDIGADLELQRDGKLVLVGGLDFTVARFNSAGSLDGGFGSGGFARTDFAGLSAAGVQAWSVGIQPDGKIVVGGSTLGPSEDFALARFTARGTLDLSFSGDGRAVTDIGGPGVGDVAYALALDSRHRIVLAGLSGPPGPVAEGPYDFAVARYSGALPCVVPRLKATTLRTARGRLAKAHCTLGRVKPAYSRKVKKGRVISQTPRPGTQLPERSKVSVVVSRGRRR
jgi:uncharacterized delta-60 repeat protein